MRRNAESPDPPREILFTVTTREEKYKAKNLIDTVVYRGGDALSGWAFSGLIALGLGMSGIALVALPLSDGVDRPCRLPRPRRRRSPNFSRGALPR